MKAKRLFIVTVIIFTQIVVSFGQFIKNFQAVYPVNNWMMSTTNFTLARGVDFDGYLLAANPAANSLQSNFVGIKLDNDFNIQFFKAYRPDFAGVYLKFETKDAISTTDRGYIICGNIDYGHANTRAFIAKFDDSYNFMWAKIYTSISKLNAIKEIIVSEDIKYKYIAVGTTINNETTVQLGVILCINEIGDVIWENNTGIQSLATKYVYNQLIPVANDDTKFPDFAIVGNAFQSNNKDVIVTKVDIFGNNKFSFVYGNPANSIYSYDEEGNGITIFKDQLFICGHLKAKREDIVFWDGVLLTSIDKTNGGFNWSKIYDFPLKSENGDYAQSIMEYKENLFINGYYKSTVFNSNVSDDAFLMQTDLDGVPSNQLKVFGDFGEDRIFKLMLNNKEDGITNAGYSSSYNFVNRDYAPYIIEAYNSVEKECYDKYLDLHYETYEFPQRGLEFQMVKTDYVKLELKEYDLHVEPNIVCEKVPIADNKVMSIDKNQANKVIAYTTAENSLLIVTGISGNAIYKIYSQTGKLLQTGCINNNESINIASLASGLYFISIDNNSNIYNIKFIK
jgi:hypothetical protein